MIVLGMKMMTSDYYTNQNGGQTVNGIEGWMAGSILISIGGWKKEKTWAVLQVAIVQTISRTKTKIKRSNFIKIRTLNHPSQPEVVVTMFSKYSSTGQSVAIVYLKTHF